LPETPTVLSAGLAAGGSLPPSGVTRQAALARCDVNNWRA